MSEAPQARQLRIKLGVAKRTKKELVAYENECKTQAAKADEMEAAGRDEHDIKQQRAVLAESEAMLPDTRRRLADAIEDLRELLETNATEAAVTGSPLFEEATALVAAADEEAGE